MLTWLVPITADEADVVHVQGWQAFEDALVGRNPGQTHPDLVGDQLAHRRRIASWRLTERIVFRRCPSCGERNIVRDDDFTCALCGSTLPAEWNFTSG